MTEKDKPSIFWNVAARVGVVLIGGYVVLQGILNLGAGHLSYWSVGRTFLLSPEIQISAGLVVVLFALLPLGAIVRKITRPYLPENREIRLRPIWRRRRDGQKKC